MMEEKRSRRQFTREFKVEAVELFQRVIYPHVHAIGRGQDHRRSASRGQHLAVGFTV